jgi:hypothetical protein
MLLAVIAACSGGDSPHAPHPGRGVYIPASWSDVRKVAGHDVHVVQKQVACSSCHTFGDDEIGPVTAQRCAKCHEKEARLSHAPEQARERLGGAARSDCTLCHRFSDAPLVGAVEAKPGGAELGQHLHQAGDCAHCHLTAQDDTAAVQVHAKQQCLDCHRPHEDATPQSGPCAQCHQDITPTHAVHGKSPNQVCTTCHQQQHAPAAAALETCAECHAKQQPLVPASALFDAGHQECVGCHRPHEFAKEKAAPCRGCHETVRVLAQAKVPAHQQCTSCHNPHDVRGSPDQACARCHQSQKPDHPKKGLAGSCVGCHDPHPAFGHENARVGACSTCHQAAHKDTAFHAGVDCKRCHAPHDFVRELSDHRACESCHAAQLASAAHRSGHQACEGCHVGLPHHPTLPMAGCQTCHAGEAAEVAQGHARCTGCHEPHGGAQSAACSSCHKQEHATAPAGHQTCNKCHDAHSGSAAAAPCASCHAAEAKTDHGRISANCQDCHRPHGPLGPASPPACTACHQRDKLAGLHQVDKHSQCNRCHTGHGEAPGARRDGCLSCHQDRKQHFPDAPSCSSCHLFGKSR